MDTIVKFIVTIALAGILIALLPASPFTSVINSLSNLPYLNYINWFIPIGQIMGVTFTWATAVVGYWVVGWVLRQLDIIGA